MRASRGVKSEQESLLRAKVTYEGVCDAYREKRGRAQQNIHRHEAVSHAGAQIDLLTLFPESQNFIDL